MPALASPVYRRFIIAAFVGSIGNWMQSTAQGWLVLDLTDSRFALGATSAASTAPILLLSIFAGVRGYLNKLEVNQVTRFEQGLLNEIRTRHPEILERIRTEREISPETEEKLKAALDQFARTFA